MRKLHKHWETRAALQAQLEAVENGYYGIVNDRRYRSIANKLKVRMIQLQEALKALK